MKLSMYPHALNGNRLSYEQFGYVVNFNRKLGFTPEGIESIKFLCRGNKNRECCIPITLGPAVEINGIKYWHWDGNMESPTLSPSIDCCHRCGWHGHLINGEIK